MKDRRSSFDHGQRGAVMVLVLVILVALLAGGAVLLQLQLGSTRQTGVAADKRAALYCAEAGLTAARAVIVNNYADWSLILDADGGNDPAWYPVTGDLDGDGTADYEVRLRDNDDVIDRTEKSDPLATVEARMEKKLGEHFALFVGARNLLDARDEEFDPIRPRVVYGGLSARN